MRILGALALTFCILAGVSSSAFAVRLNEPALRSTYDDKCKASGGHLAWDGNGLCWRCTKRNVITLKSVTLWCKD